MKKILDTLELKKAAPEEDKPKTQESKPVIHGGRLVMPGKLLIGKDTYDLYGEDSDHYHINYGGQLRKFSKQMGQVLVPHRNVSDDTRIDSKVHTLPGVTNNPEQHELVHGLAMGSEISEPEGSHDGINSDSSGWKKNARGENVYVKFTGTHGMSHPDFSEAEAEASYYDTAKNFWGLGEHVPVATAVIHPVTGQKFAVIKGIDGGEHFVGRFVGSKVEYKPEQQTALLRAGDDGTIDKIHIMNIVNGNRDRHSGNYMFDKNTGRLMLIDHGLAVPPNPRSYGFLLHPGYLNDYENMLLNVGRQRRYDDPLHPEAVKWALALEPAKLDAMWKKHGMPKRVRDLGIGRLMSIQEKLREDPTQHRHGVLSRPELEVLDELRD